MPPGVVVTADAHQVTVVPLYTNGRVWAFGGTPVVDWAEAGLSRPSSAARRVVRLARSDVARVVGQMSDGDRDRVVDMAQACAA